MNTGGSDMNIKLEIDGFNAGWKAGKASAQAEIDEYKKLIDEIEKACDYTNSAYNIQLLINDHRGK
jgi:flagellar biosynthesis/type III secretory pathway protein FliH